MKGIELTLPEAVVELIKLERKYPSLDAAPHEIKDKMTALALSIGGIEALANDNMGYLKYLSDLSTKLYESYVSGSEKQIQILTEKLAWLTLILNNHYSESLRHVRDTQRRHAAIYVEVEKYRSEHPESKIKPATDAIARKLDIDPKYAHTRYYEFRKRYDDMPVQEVIKRFHLAIP